MEEIARYMLAALPCLKAILKKSAYCRRESG
jgi:hypothetical protein